MCTLEHGSLIYGCFDVEEQPQWKHKFTFIPVSVHLLTMLAPELLCLQQLHKSEIIKGLFVYLSGIAFTLFYTTSVF